LCFLDDVRTFFEENPQNPLDFAQKRLEFRPNSTAIIEKEFIHGFAIDLIKYGQYRKIYILKRQDII